MSAHRRGCIAGLLLGAALLTPPAIGAAHPHVFVDVSVRLLFGAEGLSGLRVVWTFDEMVSSTLHAAFDTNRDGRFSPEETRAIERQFRTLKREHYYLDVRLDRRSVRIDEVTGFEASSTDGRVAYAFTVPLLPSRRGVVDIRVEDPTYFTDFQPVSGSVAETRAATAFAVQCHVVDDARSGNPPSISCAYRVKGQ